MLFSQGYNIFYVDLANHKVFPHPRSVPFAHALPPGTVCLSRPAGEEHVEPRLILRGPFRQEMFLWVIIRIPHAFAV